MEGHVHWEGSAVSVVGFADQDLEITSGNPEDPIGTLRIRADGEMSPGLTLPSDGWEEIPGTNPVLEARQDGHYPLGYIRVRTQ